jgi:hypothetical protein
MTKTARIDFFTIEMPKKSNLFFEDFLKKIHALSEDDRTQTVNFAPIRLHQLTESENIHGSRIIEGEMIRIRMNNLPSIAGLQGGVENLNLPNDKGLGEQTAFLYHPKTRVILFHNTQVGVSISSFLRYSNILGSSILNLFESNLFADPLLNKDALQRLVRIKEIRTFEYKLRVANIDNLGFLQNEELSVKEEIELIKTLKAPNIDIKLSIGHLKDNALNRESVTTKIQSLLRWVGKHPGEVSQIRISGVDEDEKICCISNLLKDVIRESIQLENNSERNCPYSIRQTALREAWQRRQDEIFSMIKPK